MNLSRRNNWLPSVFEDMFNENWLAENTRNLQIGKNIPAVNIKETNEDFSVEVAAPGMQKEDFKIELDNNLLSISTEIKEEHESEDKTDEGKFTRREFSYSSFKRSFTLPDSIDAQKIDASYENGVLNIHLPKREEAKIAPKRLIEIA